MIKYKYAIYFIWNDETTDSFNVKNAKERDLNIKNMIKSKEFKSIEYCKIYYTGEYGKHIKVL